MDTDTNMGLNDVYGIFMHTVSAGHREGFGCPVDGTATVIVPGVRKFCCIPQGGH